MVNKLDDQLNPCPFCRSKAILKISLLGWCYVECISPSCKTRGPRSKEVINAVMSWNQTRPISEHTT